MKGGWQIRGEPATVAHDRQAEYQAHEHEPEVHRSEYEEEESAPVMRYSVASGESQRGARKPRDYQKLRDEKRRVRKNAAVPRLEAWQQRRINYQ
jgi:hypothetical protein